MGDVWEQCGDAQSHCLGFQWLEMDLSHAIPGLPMPGALEDVLVNDRAHTCMHDG